ncbi:YggT family protein [Rummeliibacillus pycnus]|uniref:YggT family protein n=1 Tax=Rummeliibacillus pycnus TaxID=101070 RepID=UPI000C9A18E2|nr:YggT family protein [Rummeliibacillus pycnus]
MSIFIIINYLFQFYSIALIVYILMSWIPAAYNSAVGRFLAKICDPYLDFFRRFIPPIGMIDISPIAALLVLNLVQKGVFYLLIYII